MMATGTLLITFVNTPKFPNFWRMVFNDPAVTTADIDFILAELDRIGADL
jgi:glutamate decarboxylase